MKLNTYILTFRYTDPRTGESWTDQETCRAISESEAELEARRRIAVGLENGQASVESVCFSA